MKWFRDLGIATKLILGFTFVALIAGAVGVVGIRSIRTIDNADTAMFQLAVAPADEVTSMAKDLQRVRVSLLDMITATTPEAVATYRVRLDDAANGFNKALESIGMLQLPPAVREAVDSIKSKRALWAPVRDEIASLAAEGKKAEAEQLVHGHGRDVVKAFESQVDSLAERLAATGQSISEANTALARRSVVTMVLALALGVISALVLGYVLARIVSRPIQHAMEKLEAVAQGDLTVRASVTSRDELGRLSTALNQAVEAMHSSVAAIGHNAQTLASASEEMSAVSTQMGANAEETSAQAGVVSAAAEQVSSNVQTVATGTEEMTASIKEIAKNAQQAAQIATGAAAKADQTNAIITQLGVSSREIGAVLKAITSIAEQTNLLALNATIEAARAGEAGKGFAVVANEVKELAKETAKATEDITRKISAIQADTQGAVAAIGEITEVIKQLNDIGGSIASAVEEQAATTNEIGRNVTEAAKGSADIAQNITGVATAAQSTTGGAQNAQQAAGELARMAAELQQLVSRFTYEAVASTQAASLEAARARPVALRKVA